MTNFVKEQNGITLKGDVDQWCLEFFMQVFQNVWFPIGLEERWRPLCLIDDVRIVCKGDEVAVCRATLQILFFF